jgi:acetolactate synthase-1/2/3 large subunit
MAKMTGAEAIVGTLKNHGVDTVFGLPGIQLDNLFDALYGARQSLRTLHTRHEQGAAYMALGYSQTTGKVGVCTVVPGPGLLNAAAALCTASGSNVPVLCLAGQIPSRQIGMGLGIVHELLDQERAIGGVVPWVGRAEEPANVPTVLADAFRSMLAGRQQPAVLEVPPDILGKAADVALLDPELYAERIPDLAQIEAAACLLAEAKSPAIFVGSGVFGAEAELQNLAEMLEAPVVMSRTGLGALSARHRLTLGMLGGQEIWDGVDVALVVGTRFLLPALSWGRERDVHIIRIDVDAVQLQKPHAAEISLVAHARPALAALVKILARHDRERPSRTAELNAVRRHVAGQLAELEPQNAFACVIRDEMPYDGIRSRSAMHTRRHSAPRWETLTARCCRYPAMEASCLTYRNSPPPSPTISAWYRSSSTTAPSAMSSASRRRISAAGTLRSICTTRILLHLRAVSTC